VRRAYLLLAVAVGWVFFRADTFSHAADYLRALFLAPALSAPLHPAVLFLDPVTVAALVAGIVGSAPWSAILARRRERACARRPLLGAGLELAASLALALVFAASALELSSSAYNPFIYFRF
jgi:alginate O-acetyltransferase complex protein AlgI